MVFHCCGVFVMRCAQIYLFAGTGLALLLFVAAVNVIAADNPDQKLKQLHRKIDELQSDLGGLRGRRDAEQERLRVTEKKIGRLTRTLQDLKLKQQKKKARLRDLEQQHQQQKLELKQQDQALALQLRIAYRTGRQEHLKMFLSQQEPQKIGRILTYYSYFNQARINHIEQLRARLAEIAQFSAKIEQERHEIVALAEQQNRQKQALEKSRQARTRVLSALKQDIGKGNYRLGQLRQDERQLKRLLSRLEKAKAADIPDKSSFPFGRAGNHLPWPVEGVIKARFGSVRTSKLRWKGVLIDAAEGRPVQAISEGKVVFADWLRGYGLLIIVDHGSGYMSLYGHNQSLHKEAGSRVNAGEMISTVGDSGGHEHVGLYFEIRHNGRPVDPARWCVARK